MILKDELNRMWKSSGYILKYYPSICLERLRKTMKNLQHSWLLG
jgi:hypothetical protein